MEFDSGVWNFIVKCVLWIVKVDVVDYGVYWKLLDVMVDCIWDGEYCEIVLGGGYL